MQRVEQGVIEQTLLSVLLKKLAKGLKRVEKLMMFFRERNDLEESKEIFLSFGYENRNKF